MRKFGWVCVLFSDGTVESNSTLRFWRFTICTATVPVLNLLAIFMFDVQFLPYHSPAPPWWQPSTLGREGNLIGLSCIHLMISDAKHLHACQSLYLCFGEGSLFKSFARLKTRLSFCCWVVRFFMYLLWILHFYQDMISKCFSPILWVILFW